VDLYQASGERGNDANVGFDIYKCKKAVILLSTSNNKGAVFQSIDYCGNWVSSLTPDKVLSSY
jgi:hypothetical protein